MRLIAFAPAALLLTLGACASSGAALAPAPAWLNGSASEHEGWALVGNGEIRLYAEERDLGRGLPLGCISAALPRNAQRAAEDLNGAKVRLHGRTAAWADRSGGRAYDWQGSKIVNDCRNETVILADRVDVLQ